MYLLPCKLHMLQVQKIPLMVHFNDKELLQSSSILLYIFILFVMFFVPDSLRASGDISWQRGGITTCSFSTFHEWVLLLKTEYPQISLN